MNIRDFTETPGPGKFEGEPPWAEYFYNLMLDGAATVDTWDIDEASWALFDLSDYERTAAREPFSAETLCIGLTESDQGFVSVHEFDRISTVVESWLTDERTDIDFDDYITETEATNE